MSWPRATDYSAAIQNPSACFADEELRAGVVATTDVLLGLPLSYSGNFATVYKMLCPGDQVWAVKCFTRPVEDLRDRYHLISQHLEANRRRFAVEFCYLAEGIHVNGDWYPVLKMRWVEGFTLNEFLRDHACNASLLDQLAQLWLRLAVEMRETNMAHGDLQHGNVLLVPGRSGNAMGLRLIDYDGMWVPALADRPPHESGHPNYQHPRRPRDGGYDAEMDRFGHLVIYTALRALRAGGRSLWDRHDNGENLLFKEADFRQPERSKLFAELLATAEPRVQSLAAHLLDASDRPLEKVPLLADLVEQVEDREASRKVERVHESTKRRAAEGEVPPVPVPCVVEVPIGDALPVGETATQSQRLLDTNLDVPVVPPPLPPPWPVRAALAADGVLNWLWPVTVGLFVGLPLAGFALWLAWPVFERPRHAVVSMTPVPRLFALAPVTLRAGGRANLLAIVDRPRPVGPLQIRVEGLPEGVTCAPDALPEGAGPGSVTLKLLTTIDTPAVSEIFSVILYEGETKLHEQRVPLTVTPFPRPRLAEVTPMPIVLTAGVRERIVARVEARGNTDRWTLRLDHDDKLPGLVQEPTPRELLRGDQVGIDLLARSDARAVEGRIARVVLVADGHVCDHKLVAVTIERPMADAAVTVVIHEEVRLRQGRTARVSVQLIRRGYDGPLTLRVKDAPPGVTCPDVEVPRNANRAELTLEATPKAGGRLGLGAARVTALMGEKQVGEAQLILHLEKGKAR